MENPFPRFASFTPSDELGSITVDGALIAGTDLFNMQAMVGHYGGRARKYQILISTQMGAAEMATRCAFMAAQAMVNICNILIDHAEIVTPEAAEIRQTGKAAGLRCKAMMDLFDALMPETGKAEATAAAFVSVTKMTLTDIFDDVLCA